MENKVILEELVNQVPNIELVVDGELFWEGSTVIKSTEVDMNFLIHSYEDSYSMHYVRLDEDGDWVTSFVQRYEDVEELVSDITSDIESMKMRNQYNSLIDSGLTMEEAFRQTYFLN